MKGQHKYFCLSVMILISFIFFGVLETKPVWSQFQVVISTIDVGNHPGPI